MNFPKLDQVIKALRSKGYPVFTKKEFDLTFYAVRTGFNEKLTRARVSDKFDDWVGVIWREGDKLRHKVTKATTDPGLYYLTRPMNPAGTAIIKPGHYPGVWARGRHSTQQAFRQKGNITVYRDRNRDRYLDMGPNTPTQTGDDFLINFHRANASRNLPTIGRWSAGCIVAQQAGRFAEFVHLGDKQIKETGINSFSLSLLVESDFK